MKGQKEYIVELVKHHLPNFVPGRDIALIQLPPDKLEHIKNQLVMGISLGTVSYTKDPLNKAEVIAYARSCVMNHLKKAKELNGGVTYGKTQVPSKEEESLSSINMDALPDDLKEYVKKLV